MQDWLFQDGISLLDVSAAPLSLGSIQGDLRSAFSSSTKNVLFQKVGTEPLKQLCAHLSGLGREC